MRKVVKKAAVQEVSLDNIDPKRFVYVCVDECGNPFRLRVYGNSWNFYSDDSYYFGIKFSLNNATVKEIVKTMMDYGKVYEFENFVEYYSWYLKEIANDNTQTTT